MISDVKQIFKQLSKKQKELLLKLCLEEQNQDMDFMSVSQNNCMCPHCGHNHIVKMGKNGNTQKFKCKDCGKMFSVKTKTLFANSNKPISLWKEYIQLMFDGLTLEKISKRLSINIKTAFYWRHKILKVFNSMKTTQLKGIIEVDETYFRESQKGSKHISRPARKRGGSSKFAKTNRITGTSKEKVCVLCAIDRTKTIYNKPVCFGKPNDAIIMNNLEKVFEKQSTIISDKLIAYKNAFENRPYNLKSIKGGISKNDVYNLQRINAYHSGLKEWIRRFKGVSTKYLDNYVNFFKIIKSCNNPFEEIIKLHSSCLVKEIQNKVIDF